MRSLHEQVCATSRNDVSPLDVHFDHSVLRFACISAGATAFVLRRLGGTACLKSGHFCKSGNGCGIVPCTACAKCRRAVFDPSDARQCECTAEDGSLLAGSS